MYMFDLLFVVDDLYFLAFFVEYPAPAVGQFAAADDLTFFGLINALTPNTRTISLRGIP